MSDPVPTTTATRRIAITRTFDAPREEVFAAWVEPDQVAGWYGPEHLDTPRDRVVIEPRVGGRWELTMVQRDGGKEFPVRYEIEELVAPELLVLRCDPMPEIGLAEGTVTRVELHAEGDRTRMVVTDGPYPEQAGGGAEAGWTSAFDGLARHLAGGR